MCVCACVCAFCSIYYLKDTCALLCAFSIALCMCVMVREDAHACCRGVRGQAHARVVTCSIRPVAGSKLDSLKPRAPTSAADTGGEKTSNSKRGAHSNASSSPMKPATSASVPLNANAAGPADSLHGRKVTVFASPAVVCTLVCVRACAPRERCRSQTPHQVRRSMF